MSITRKTVAEFVATNPSRQIDVVVDGNVQGDWDAARLGQVLSNLVGNALRHGTVNVPITVRLFEPFQSGGGKRTRAEGLGLGLYIVQQIVHSHGGEVRVSSSEEAGTSFEIRLPRHAQG